MVVATLKQQRHVLNCVTAACDVAARGTPVPALFLSADDCLRLLHEVLHRVHTRGSPDTFHRVWRNREAHRCRRLLCIQCRYP
jgi:hypothetical protein